MRSQWPVVQESASAQQTAFDQFTALTMHHTSSAVNANISFRLKVCGLSQSASSRWPCDPTPPVTRFICFKGPTLSAGQAGCGVIISISRILFQLAHKWPPSMAFSQLSRTSRLAEHAHSTNQSVRIALRLADAITNRACLKM